MYTNFTLHAHLKRTLKHYTNGVCGPHVLYTGFISFGPLNKHALGYKTKEKKTDFVLYCVFLRATPPTALRIIFY